LFAERSVDYRNRAGREVLPCEIPRATRKGSSAPQTSFPTEHKRARGEPSFRMRSCHTRFRHPFGIQRLLRETGPSARKPSPVVPEKAMEERRTFRFIKLLSI